MSGRALLFKSFKEQIYSLQDNKKYNLISFLWKVSLNQNTKGNSCSSMAVPIYCWAELLQVVAIIQILLENQSEGANILVFLLNQDLPQDKMKELWWTAWSIKNVKTQKWRRTWAFICFPAHHSLFTLTRWKEKQNTSVSRGKEQHKGKTLQLEKKQFHTAAAATNQNRVWEG